MFIIIAGGGRVGYYLLKELIHHGQEVVLIEKNRDRSKKIVSELGNLVINGDACEPRVLEKAGIQRAEMIIANTGADEDNLIICQIARNKFRVPSAVALVNNPKNDEIFKRLGIDATVSSIDAILSVIERKVTRKGVITTLGKEGDIEITQARLTRESPVSGKTLGELGLPPGARVAAVIRGGEVLNLESSLELKVNDLLITLSKSGDFEKLKEILSGPELIFHAP